MPENVKWELISFALKLAPVLLGLLLAYIGSRVPSVAKAMTRLRTYVSQAASIVNQTFVEPRKAGGKWDEAAKEQARELFWAKFLELSMDEAEYWLKYLLEVYGEAQLKDKILGNELEDELQALKN
jgi:hypothetical protein